MPFIRKFSGLELCWLASRRKPYTYLMADQHRLRFPLLSDAGNKVAKQFGLAYRVPEYQQEIYQRAFVNLPFANGDNSWELPIPATYVIGQDSNIEYAAANPD